MLQKAHVFYKEIILPDLMKSFATHQMKNSLIYRKLLLNADVETIIKLLPTFGFTCLVNMSNTTRAKIIIEQEYDFFWDNYIQYMRMYRDSLELNKFKRTLEIEHSKQKNTEHYQFALLKGAGSWRVVYDGVELPIIKHYKIMDYIQYLILHKKDRIHISDLCRNVEGFIVGQTSGTINNYFDDGLSEVSKPSYEIQADNQATSEYRKRLKELSGDRRQAEEKGDVNALQDVNEEFDRIKGALIGVKGSRGQTLTLAPEVKREYNRLKNGFDRLLKKLDVPDYHDFYHHISNSITIKVGSCSYNPDRDINWKFY